MSIRPYKRWLLVPHDTRNESWDLKTTYFKNQETSMRFFQVFPPLKRFQLADSYGIKNSDD